MITLINGHIQTPNGFRIPNGSISFQLNMDATVVASPFGFVSAADPVTFQFDENGDLIQPAQIWSNSELNPQNSSGLGTYYLVTLYDSDGARVNRAPMWWQFPNPAGATVDISSMTALSTIGGNVIFYPNLSGSAFNGVNPQIANYTATVEDSGKLIVFASNNPVTCKLPATVPSDSWFVLVQNIGPGTLTIDCNGNTLDSASANLPIPVAQGVIIGSSGTGFFTERGLLTSSVQVSSYLGWRNVMDFGAVGDGIHDDGPAIQAAINASLPLNGAGGGSVYFPRPPLEYHVETTIVVGSLGADGRTVQLRLLGDAGPQNGGTGEFSRAPRVHINGDAEPIFDFLSSNDDPFVTIENLDIFSFGKCAVRFRENWALITLRNSGVAANPDKSDTLTAPLTIQGSSLWFKATDCSFNTEGQNTGPYNPAPGQTIDPTSWNSPSVLINAYGGSILFHFADCQFAYGGVKMQSLTKGPFTVTSIEALAGVPPENYAILHGTFTGGDANAFLGMNFTVRGFLNGVNNFDDAVCRESTATTLKLRTNAAVAETHAATAIYGDVGQTYGEFIFDMNVLEGSFAPPLLQFENVSANGGSASFGRVFMTECQCADVDHETPLISIKGNASGGHTVSASNFFLVHCLGHGAAVQSLGNATITAIHSEDSVVQRIFDINSKILSSSGLISTSQNGYDLVGAPAGPTEAYKYGVGKSGALRTFDSTQAGYSGDGPTATSLRDMDGTDYFGAGLNAPFDMHVGRQASVKWGVELPVPAPTNIVVTATAGGSLPDGVYYLRMASGDRNNPPNTVSAACAENAITGNPVTLGGGNNTISLTWTPAPTNTGGKITIYMTLANGGAGNEVKASNGTDLGSGTISTLPGSNNTPSEIGDLLSSAFQFDGNGNVNPGGVVLTTDDAHTPVAPAVVVAWLKIKSSGQTYYLPLSQ